jgi:hypothetical protein
MIALGTQYPGFGPGLLNTLSVSRATEDIYEYGQSLQSSTSSCYLDPLGALRNPNSEPYLIADRTVRLRRAVMARYDK